MAILEVKNLNKYYIQGKYKNHILKNITMSVNEGDFLGIIGPSGSGKTTLLYCLSSLETIDNGEISLDGQNINNLTDSLVSELRQKHLGFIFQFYNLVPNLTAYENVLLASVIAGKNDEDKINELFALVGMSEYRDYYPNELSGGMQQRIAIARALVNTPRILFADEPTGNLDQKKGKEIMDLLEKLNKDENLTIILVTHNEDYLKYCNKTINLIDGEFIDNK
ncbi:MAG: macrolide ABC transporter ATP-binding protein [Tenericutes bacterium HGW-Tenericutes-5]|nr:MAG: macrolide ABC transporter ATP-binding protein [Tenericutes bacterium HGW-Tenericutes-5]